MNSTTATVFVPLRLTAPRGAQLVGLVYDVLARANLRLGGWIAAREQRRLAAEAEEVRRIASRIEASDPGMAADLRAAADRHAG